MGLGDWADDLARLAEQAQARAGALFEPTLRLGVTGLSGAGKTVFITSLVANLLRRGRMSGLKAEAEGRILATMLTPQPDLDAPRFAFEEHLQALYGRPPVWPESTRSISQLRLSIRYRPDTLLGRVTGESSLHLDIVDYPGEWLLDLGLMEKSFAVWSEEAVAAAERRAKAGSAEAARFLDWLSAQTGQETGQEAGPESSADKTPDEPILHAGAAAFAAHLRAAKADGAAALAPGRFLLPGDLEGAPALTFAPLRPNAGAALRREMARRFEGYKNLIVKPFFQNHFARLDRQIVLVDALGAVSRGPSAAAETAHALRDILAAFRPGENSWLSRLLGPAIAGRRVERLLLAVSRADHIHHESHPALQLLVRDLLARSVDRAAYSGAVVEAMAIASVRATVEDEIRRAGRRLPAVRGRLAGEEGLATLYPGEPPEHLGEMLAAGEAWDRESFEIPDFAAPVLEHRPDEGPPHLRLDRALEFLIGDRLA